jgi:hypothetical protein
MAAKAIGERAHMRSRFLVLGVVATLAAAMGIPAAAQAAPETAPVLTNHGCGSLWNPGSNPDGTPTTGTYGVVTHSGSYDLTFASKSSLESHPGYVPNFCNLSISNLPGHFEIADPNDPGSDGDGCLAVDTATDFIVDDTPSACNTQEYAWDEWHAEAVGTYHGNTEWEFISDESSSSGCLTDVAGLAYWSSCYTGSQYQLEFVWSNSGL